MKSALLLDAGYTPMDVISYKQAIKMFMLNKVEIVEEYEDELRSAYLVIKIPAVVRLINKVSRRKRKKGVKFSRIGVYARDGFRCQYCGAKKASKDFTFDHVVPRSRGGKTNWVNIVTSCVPCNRKKSNRTPAEAGMSLLKEPKEPKWLPVISIRVSTKSIPEAWSDYLYWTTDISEEPK